MDSKDGSPYIANFDLVPPSPPSRSQQQQLELDPDSPFNVNNHQYDPHHDPLTSPPFLDSVANFDNIDIDIVEDGDNIHNSSNSHLGSGHNSPHLQHLHQQHHNQSYNSSYYNSPYSQTSELSFTGEELNFELLSDMVDGIGGESHRRFNDGDDGNEGREYEEYNPSDYDGQSTSSVSATSPPPMGGLMSGTMGMGEVPASSLLMYAHADADYVSPHFSPDAMDRRPGQGQGHSLTQQHLQQQQLQHQQQQQHRSRNSPFDHSSPSSNGDPGDSGNSFVSATDHTATRHSRASSTNSVHHGYNNPQQQQQHLSPSPQPPASPQPGFLNHQNQNIQPHPSPRTFDVARSLGNMSVHTPNWGTQPLPSLSVSQAHSPNLRHNSNSPLPQMQQNLKPQSPPRLQMPEDMQFNTGRQQQQMDDSNNNNNGSSLTNSLLMAGVPKINAPDESMGQQEQQNGDGGNRESNNNTGNNGGLSAGPRFHIVPATPISGGGADGGAGVPFQQTLATLTQGSELGFGLQQQQQQQQHLYQQQQRNPSPARSSAPPSNSVSPSPSPAPSPDPERETFQQQQQQGTHSRHASTSPFVGPVALPGSAPNSAGLNTASSTGANTGSSTGGFVFPDMMAMTPVAPPPANNNSSGLGVFGHAPGRGRSNSDTWGQYEYQQQQAQVQRLQAAQAAAQLHRQQQQAHAHTQAMQTFSFGGNNNNNNGANENGNFLSPDSGNAGPGGLRRSISISSDTLGAPSRGHRVSRSEDVRLPMMGAGFGPQQQLGTGQGQQQQYMQNQQQQYPTHHAQSNSMGGGLYLDYQQQQQQQQFLHPLHVPNMGIGASGGSVSGGSTGGGPGSTGGGSRRSLSPGLGGSGGSSTGAGGFAVGHFRRASSGSRSDRGAEVWGSQAVGGGMSGHGHSASIGTLGVPRRVSPYPSPNASPRVRYGELEEDDGSGMGLGMGMGGVPHGLGLPSNGGVGMGLGMSIGISSSGMSGGLPEIGEPPVSAGYSEEVAITGRGTYMNDGASSQGGRRRAESSTSIGADAASAAAAVAAGAIKQNVTTGRTANASIRRRKQDANFACTVPGCNSTFTRGFNLKGHLRSHFEQKPYKCHWPGCGKGFARQHDCKRHEQLHSNYRPFECEGCRKQFARMDALNRHLRSEAGAECAKIVEKSKENGGTGLASGSRDVGMEYDEPSSGDDGDEEKPQLPVTTRSGRVVPRRRQTGGMDEEWGVAL